MLFGAVTITVEPHYNGHLGAKSSWLLYRGGLFTEWHSKSIVYVQCRQHPPNRQFPPPSCLGRSLPLSWQRYATEHRLDRKLADFKADVQQAQDEAATKAVNRVQNDKPYHYKKKAHEEQARFNAQVEESVQEAHDAFAAIEDSPAIQRARDALGKGARLLADRQKLIKIADRSDNGWGVVAEYTADELAEDSDDEKRLEKAEKTLLLSAADDRTTVTTDAKLA